MVLGMIFFIQNTFIQNRAMAVTSSCIQYLFKSVDVQIVEYV